MGVPWANAWELVHKHRNASVDRFDDAFNAIGKLRQMFDDQHPDYKPPASRDAAKRSKKDTWVKLTICMLKGLWGGSPSVCFGSHLHFICFPILR